MSYAKRIVGGGTLIFFMYFIGGLLGYSVRLFLARSLSVSDFGLFYAILAFTGFLTLFRDPGFSTTLTKFVAEFKAKKDFVAIKSSFSIILILEILISGFVVISVFIFSDYISVSYFKTYEAVLPLKIMILSYFASVFVTVQFVFLGLGKIKYYSIMEPVRNISTFSAIAMLIGLGVVGAAIGYLVGAIFLVIIITLLLFRSFPILSTKTHINKDLTKKLILFSFPVFLTGVAGTILGYTDTIIITFFLSVKEVGFYQVALPTSQLLWVLTSSLSVIMLPIVSEMWAKKDTKSLSNITSLLTKYLFIITIPIVIVIVAFPDAIIRILFGNDFLPASQALQILALSSLFYPIFSLVSTSIVAIGKPMTNTKIIAAMTMLNLAMNIVLVPSIGIIGAALATTLSYFFGTLLMVFYFRKDVRFHLYPMDMMKAFFGGVFTFAVVVFTKNLLQYTNIWIEIFVAVSAGVLFYIAFIILTYTVKRNEIEKIREAGVPIPKVVMKIVR